MRRTVPPTIKTMARGVASDMETLSLGSTSNKSEDFLEIPTEVTSSLLSPLSYCISSYSPMMVMMSTMRPAITMQQVHLDIILLLCDHCDWQFSAVECVSCDRMLSPGQLGLSLSLQTGSLRQSPGSMPLIVGGVSLQECLPMHQAIALAMGNLICGCWHVSCMLTPRVVGHFL